MYNILEVSSGFIKFLRENDFDVSFSDHEEFNSYGTFFIMSELNAYSVCFSKVANYYLIQQRFRKLYEHREMYVYMNYDESEEINKIKKYLTSVGMIELKLPEREEDEEIFAKYFYPVKAEKIKEFRNSVKDID